MGPNRQGRTQGKTLKLGLGVWGSSSELLIIGVSCSSAPQKGKVFQTRVLAYAKLQQQEEAAEGCFLFRNEKTHPGGSVLIQWGLFAGPLRLYARH